MIAIRDDIVRTCFICGEVLTPANRSDEHFVPKWFPRTATERLRMRLANGSTARPRNLRVPCCRDCNGAFADIEDRTSRAMRQGPGSVRELDRRDTAAWVAKALWGFAVFESRARSERHDPLSGPILRPEKLSFLAPLERVCQEWLAGMATGPGSLHTFHAQHDHGDDVDYVDDPPAGLLGIRLGPSAVIFSAVDHGDAERLSRHTLVDLGFLPVFTDLKDLALGPIQFREVFAWARTLHRSRAPFPPPGQPFGPYIASVHKDHLRQAIGVLPAFEGRDVGGTTFLFEQDMTPRFVSISQTRE